MLKALRRMLRIRPDGEDSHDHLAPQGERATFVLRYEDMIVGHLILGDGRWTFRYSPDFRQQNAVQPIIGFPDTDRAYVAESLWPFFVARIPSASQPDVHAVIKREGLDEHNDLQLLRRFGKRTIANPFELVEQP